MEIKAPNKTTHLSASLVKWSESSYHFAVGYGYGGDETAIRRPDYWQEDHPRLRKDLHNPDKSQVE